MNACIRWRRYFFMDIWRQPYNEGMLRIPELLCGLLHHLLEMLVILAGVPVTSPGEAVLFK